MSSDVDAIVDRRRLRRKVTLWRILAILALVAGVLALGAVVGVVKVVVGLGSGGAAPVEGVCARGGRVGRVKGSHGSCPVPVVLAKPPEGNEPCSLRGTTAICLAVNERAD